ncbi:MAG: SCO1664 family protein, partial [Actinobacteria bacterium]|nr:SCO1664 family protein [Actinomycetota bacterium]
MEVIGRLIDASNASLLCQYPDGKKIIYKPIAGERPLWDFPDGNLASREVVAYYISELGGFHLVPKTVLRDGPFGLGAVQEWIEVDEEVDVVNFVQSDGSILRNMALFDAIINNADRKFGHILVGPDGDVYGCDHGVSFHEEDKLRTVL